MSDANTFIGVRAVFVTISAITSVDVAVVAEIIAGVVTNARDIVSVQQKGQGFRWVRIDEREARAIPSNRGGHDFILYFTMNQSRFLVSLSIDPWVSHTVLRSFPTLHDH